MMTRTYLSNLTYSDNILYIGDEAKACLHVIEKFNNLLSAIEQTYSGWFNSRSFSNHPSGYDHLQHHIQYHFEGGIAIFKFRNNDELPDFIRQECLNACRSLAEEQIYAIC